MKSHSSLCQSSLSYTSVFQLSFLPQLGKKSSSASSHLVCGCPRRHITDGSKCKTRFVKRPSILLSTCSDHLHCLLLCSSTQSGGLSFCILCNASRVVRCLHAAQLCKTVAAFVVTSLAVSEVMLFGVSILARPWTNIARNILRCVVLNWCALVAVIGHEPAPYIRKR